MTANSRRKKSRQKDKTSQTESDVTQQAISRSDLHQGKKRAGMESTKTDEKEKEVQLMR